jgi:hypothetical protein
MKAKVTDRHKAAKKRIDVAIAHLTTACEEVNWAAADLSRVKGATAPYQKLVKHHAGLAEAIRMLDQAKYDGEWTLDHEPTPQELRCGHGPQHGCGRGKKR